MNDIHDNMAEFAVTNPVDRVVARGQRTISYKPILAYKIIKYEGKKRNPQRSNHIYYIHISLSPATLRVSDLGNEWKIGHHDYSGFSTHPTDIPRMVYPKPPIRMA